MLKNLMEDKRLDFNAPLLSVRRFASAAAPAPPPSSGPPAAAAPASGVEDGNRTAGERPPPKRSSFPFYKSELKSGPVRNPGSIPFIWEQTPGQPKDGSSLGFGGPGGKSLNRPPVAPKLPPGRISKRADERESNGASAVDHSSNGPISSSEENVVKSVDISEGDAELKPKLVEEAILEDRPESNDDEGDAFSDALDTLSRTESCFMNCSISGLTGGGGSDKPGPSGSFSTDPLVRDFMMGRFLPAAKAAASASPQWTSRKPPARDIPGRIENGERRRPLPLPYQHRPNPALQYAHDHCEEGGDSDDDNDYDDTGHLSLKGCGLLPRFCLKSSIFLMNPVPAVKVRSRAPLPSARKLRPQFKPSLNGSLGNAGDGDTWDAVYKHKLGRGNQLHGEDGSKLTSESNQLTYWSDSQTPDGSSPYQHSPGGCISPYRNDAPQSPFHEGKGFLGVPRNETESCRDDVFDSCSKEGDKYWEVTPHLSNKQGLGSVSLMAEKTLYVDSVTMPETPDSKSSSADSKGMINAIHKSSDVTVESQRMEESPVLDSSGRNAPQLKAFEFGDADLPCSSYRSNPGGQMDNTKRFRCNDGVEFPQPLKVNREKNDTSSLQPILPPPLPKSPSESWLWRTLPSVSSKNPTRQSFLGIQFHPRKQAVRASSTDPKWETIVKTSNEYNGQIRFSEVLANPVNKE